MRPNSPALQNLIRSFRESSPYIYAISAGFVVSCIISKRILNEVGVELPDDLILVHEFGDHYSLQAAREMTVDGTFHYLRPIEEELLERYN
jgi:hypothetical protein